MRISGVGTKFSVSSLDLSAMTSDSGADTFTVTSLSNRHCHTSALGHDLSDSTSLGGKKLLQLFPVLLNSNIIARPGKCPFLRRI